MKVKGHEITLMPIRDSFSRRAQKFKNNIIENLRKIGLTADDVELELERVAIKNVPASVTWYLEGHVLFYEFKKCAKYVENLYVVSKVIEAEVAEVLSGEKSIQQFCLHFSESDDVDSERKQARIDLGVSEDEMNWKVIDKAYKKLSLRHHPDMPDGDHERFQEVNKAHKILRRELE